MAFNPEVFRWARESAGLGPEGAARAIGIVPTSLIAIENGEKEPSRTTLSKMANVYRRSLLTFYLPIPPRKGDRGEDFRTVVGDQTVETDADVDALVRDLRARQSLVRTVLEDDQDVQPLEFVGSASMNDGVPALAASIERMLGITRAQYRAQKDVDSAFSLLRKRAGDAGVFVLLIGNLGSHHSAIPVEAFRVFAVADRIAPFIVINDGDTRAAWSFTLLHELAHLWLGATGVSGGGAPEMKIERFCNDVAAEFLLPRSDVQVINIAGLELNSQIAAVAEYANRWRVSRQMVAYGLLKAGLRPRSQRCNAKIARFPTCAGGWGSTVATPSNSIVLLAFVLNGRLTSGNSRLMTVPTASCQPSSADRPKHLSRRQHPLISPMHPRLLKHEAHNVIRF